MRTTYWNNSRGGHCPGHVRETFLNAIEAYEAWEVGEPEPVVDFEVNYRARSITISKAAKLVWNCSDILPGLAWDAIDGLGLAERCGRRTYACAARALVGAIKAA